MNVVQKEGGFHRVRRQAGRIKLKNIDLSKVSGLILLAFSAFPENDTFSRNLSIYIRN